MEWFHFEMERMSIIGFHVVGDSGVDTLFILLAPFHRRSRFLLMILRVNPERKLPGSSGPREYVTLVHRFELRRGWNENNTHYSYRHISEQTALCDSKDSMIFQELYFHMLGTDLVFSSVGAGFGRDIHGRILSC